MLLVAVAAWCMVRAGDRRDATVLMAAAGVALALANITAYSTVLVDPVVILMALAHRAAAARRQGRRGCAPPCCSPSPRRCCWPGP